MIQRCFSMIIIVVAGALAATAHPFRWEDISFGASWLSIVTASAGLFLGLPLITRGSSGQRFRRGLLFGLIFFSCIFYWVAFAMYNYGNVGIWVSLLGVGSLSLYCACYWGLWALICGSDIVRSRPTFEKIIAWGASHAALEAARQWIITGFPWGELGNAFYFSPFIARTASIWGVHGLSFLWICLICTLVHLRNIDFRAYALRTAGSLLVIFLGAACIITVIQLQQEETKTISFGVIQPNISQDQKWDPTLSYNHLKKLIELSSTLDSNKLTALLWPETSYPFSVLSTETSVPMRFTAPLIFGAVVDEGKSSRNAVLLSREGQITSQFNKRHLVPFGEYVPFGDILPFGKVVAQVADFKPGSPDQALFDLGDNIKAGPLICYEDIFSRSSVHLARQGAQILLNFTNDAWYGPSSALEQHGAIAHMQVYQTGLPMIRATNNGLSALLLTRGRTEIPLFSESATILSAEISHQPNLSFFVWTYPLMEWIWFLVFAIACLWKSPRSKRKIFFQKSSPY